MPRTAISGLVCTTFLVLLGFPAVPQEPAGKGADTESGQLTFNNACRTCHTTKEGDNRLGPNLHNIIGRKAGSLQNYGYSSAMKGADFVWDKEKLDRFIAKPDEVVPGNNMKPYGGLTSAEDRAKVIVFLESPTTNRAVTARSRSLKRVAAPHNGARTASGNVLAQRHWIEMDDPLQSQLHHLHWPRLTSVRSTGRAVASGADLPEPERRL
jgi:cytochrome c